MNKYNNLLKIILTLLLVLVVIILFKYYHLRHLLSLDGLSSYGFQIMQIKTDNPYKFVIGYVVIYTILIALCIPGTIILDIIAGFLFGILCGSALMVISYGIGTIFNYFVVHYLLHDFFIKRLKQLKIKSITGNNQQQKFINLTALRLIPIIPFWALNILASVIKLRFDLFMLSTIIGIIPIAIIYAIVGDGARDTILSHEVLSPHMLMNPKIWVPLICLSIIVMLPSLVKFIKKYMT